MKKFHFPLERVRQWRENQVTIEETKLEVLNSERAGIEERIAALDQERASNESAVVGAESADAAILRALDEYRRFARFRSITLAGERQSCDQRIAEQRARIMEAQRKVRLLDKLKDRKRKAWTAAFDKEIEEQAAEAFLAKWSNE